ncbi:putative leader peptide [Nostocoides japonicum]
MSRPERSADAHVLVGYRRRHVDLVRVGSAMCRR